MPKENIKGKGIFNLKNLNRILLLAIIALTVYYVAGVNDLSIKGFALSDLEQQENKLAAANNKLELDATTLSSYSNISTRIANLKMVAVGQISYINAGVESVAIR